MRYSELEKLLADIRGTRRPQMGKLRMRLRQLRDLGKRDWRKPGSGNFLKYSENDALRLLTILALLDLGIVPRQASAIAGEAIFLRNKKGGKYLVMRRSAQARNPQIDVCWNHPVHERGCTAFAVVDLGHYEEEIRLSVLSARTDGA